MPGYSLTKDDITKRLRRIRRSGSTRPPLPSAASSPA